jgi:exodeoxyribonuclease VII small subunit
MTRPDVPPASHPEPAPDPALAELSYEQARAELAAVVERLEAGGCPLEEALALWERGEALAEVCQRRLDGARARLDRSRARVESAQLSAQSAPAQPDGSGAA